MSVDLIRPDFTAAVFDLDGTLFDSMWFWSGLDAAFLKKRGIDEVPNDYLLAIAHLGALETAIYTKERFGLADSPEELMEEWHDEAVRFYTNDVQLKDGALAYLNMLRARGIKLGVATASSPELYMPALRRLGIAELFSAFADVNECARKKGFPDVYELACSRMGAAKEDTVVFEDICIAVCGAKDGGFRTVGVYDSASECDREKIIARADAFITNFADLIQQN